MSKRYVVLVVAVLAVAVAGCGSSKKSNRSSSYSAPSAKAAQQTAPGNSDKQDAVAKSDARSLVTEVETCFVDQQTYTACKKPAGTKLAIGSGPGQVEVSAAGDAVYTVVAHSRSGTNFTVEKKASGSTGRTCDKPGKGGCKADGSW